MMTELKSRAGCIEYRVREVKRYIVTRYGIGLAPGGFLQSSQHGEFENFDVAYAVGYALCKEEHGRLGWAPLDERISYPDPEPPKDREDDRRSKCVISPDLEQANVG